MVESKFWILICAVYVMGLLSGIATMARADEGRPACPKTCAEMNDYAIRCGCGNPCMFRDGGSSDK